MINGQTSTLSRQVEGYQSRTAWNWWIFSFQCISHLKLRKYSLWFIKNFLWWSKMT